MLVKNLSLEQLKEAMKALNKKYDDNIQFNGCIAETETRIRFTLRVKETKGKGARLGQGLTSKGNRRHLINACWHVHGDLFDLILNLEPKAIIYAGAKKIYKDGLGRIVGNWEDWNIGSMINPLYYSEACECGEDLLKFGFCFKCDEHRILNENNLCKECA